MSAWSHLPNAAHIDAVLADMQARPEIWSAAQDASWPAARAAARGAVWTAARGAAWDAARGAVRNTAWDATEFAAQATAWDAVWATARDAVWATARDAVRSAAGDALYALIAWDESAALLDLTPDALRTLIDVADGDVKHQAVLLLPAVIARSTP